MRAALEEILETSPELQGYLKFDSRMHALEQIFKALQDHDIKTIWVHGRSGVGMTTLVKQVAVCAAELALFDGVVSATVVARKPDEALRGVQRQLGIALGLSLDHRFGDIGEHLFNRLTAGNFLVIVEDVWKLEERVILLMRMIRGSGCKILFTSRPWDCIHLESWFGRCANVTIGVLEENEARTLFYKTVGNEYDAEHQELAAMCNRVIERWDKRLPVLIVPIAAALSKRGEAPKWDALHQLEEMKNKIHHKYVNSPVEFISYNYLQNPHKLLFLLCGLLENISGDQIAISDLKREWSQLISHLQHDLQLEGRRNSLITELQLIGSRHGGPSIDSVISDLKLEGVGGAGPSLESLISDLKASSLLIQGETSSYVRMHELVHYAAVQIAHKAPGGIQYPLLRWLERVSTESEMEHSPISKEVKAFNRMNGLLSLVSLYPMVSEKKKKEMYKQLETWASSFSSFNSLSKEVLYRENWKGNETNYFKRYMSLKANRSDRGPLYRLEAIRRKKVCPSVVDRWRREFVMGEMSSVFSTFQPILEENLAYFPLLHVIGDLDKAPLGQGKRKAALEVEEMHAPSSSTSQFQFTLDSALSCMKISLESETVHWMGISGEGRHQVIEAFKKGWEDEVHYIISVYVSEDWTDRFRDNADEDIWYQLGSQHRNPDGVHFLNLIDFHESVDFSEWMHLYSLRVLVTDRKMVFITKLPVSCLPVDVQIKMEDHLLPWKLFCTNVGHVVHSSVPIREVAAELVERCGDNLTATIIVARALRDVSDVHVWKEALWLFNRFTIFYAAVNLVSKRRKWNLITKHCIVESLSDCKWVDKKSLITQWRSKGLTHSDGQGQEILNDLVDAFFFDSSGKPEVTRVMPQLHDVISSIFKPGQLVFHGTKGKVPTSEEWDCLVFDCSGTDLSELPANPSCYALRELLLQDNNVLTIIPSCLFESMEALKVVNMSNTSIKTLPESFFNLTTVTELVLRGCRLFKELPPQIGELVTLEVLDLEGTEIIQLPVEVQYLINLTRLKVSFYGYGELPKTMIPAGVLMKLRNLIELSLDVNPDDKRWEDNVKIVIKELVGLKEVKYEKLYLPEVEQVYYLGKHFPYLILSPYRRFHFTVGSHFSRIMSKAPPGAEAEFPKHSKCIRYVHGTEVPVKQLRYALKFTTAFFLDRHHTVTKLSQFGTENMKQLEFCVLGECSELETIIEEGPHSHQGDYGEEEYSDEEEHSDEEHSDEEEYIDGEEEESNDEEEYSRKEDGKDDSSSLTVEPVFESLKYLIIYGTENLRSIWVSDVSIHNMSLSKLKSLRLHSCPQLNTIFSLALLGNLGMLEDLIVEDCESIKSLVDPHPQPSNLLSEPFLPNLRKVSLHYLPELVSISSGLHIAPKLERMSFYDCPKLNRLSNKEVSSKHLKKIRGEEEWWNGLQWDKAEWKVGRPSDLANIFTPFKKDEDLMTQLADDENPAEAS